MTFRLFLTALCACSFLTVGCGGSDGASTSGMEAGNTGSGGDSGQSGEGGAAGQAGEGGAAGQAGEGGAAGQAGEGGAAGQAGMGGGVEPNMSGTCEKAEEFVIGEISTGSTRGAASTVVGSSCGNGGISPEAVFSFVADQEGTVCLSTERSEYDTVLFVREAECTNPEAEVACNDSDREFTGGDQSVVEFTVTPGTEYFVIVDGFGSIGNFVLSGSYGTCAEARPQTCSESFACDEGEECEAGRCIRRCEMDTNCPDPRSVCREQICVAVDCRVDAHCGGNGFCVENECIECRDGNDCQGDDLCIEGRCVGCVEDANCDTGVCELGECVECRGPEQCAESLSTPFCGANECVECLENTDCPSEAGGAETFCESFSCVECRGDADCADGLACFNNACVERARNVTCEAPNQYTVGQVILGDLEGWTDNYAGDCSSSFDALRPETVFEFTAEQSSDICVSLRDSDFDSLMYIREAPANCDSDAEGAPTCLSFCESVDAEIDCNDDNRSVTNSTNSALSITITEGKKYYIFVDRFGSQSDTSTTAFKLASSYGACSTAIPPACDDNGDCAAGLECLLGFCTVSCNSAIGEECSDRLQYCLDDVCQPFDCLVDNDCGFSETCEVNAEDPGQNRCVDCLADSECFGSDVCVNNLCEQCGTDAHCSTLGLSNRYYCASNSCVQCTESSQCVMGECSASNTCVECISDEQCGDAFCVSNGCVECRVADDCAAGFGCGSDGTCNNCSEDSDCGEGLSCDTLIGECVACVDTADCAMGESCVNAVCVTPAAVGTCEMPTAMVIGEPTLGDTSMGAANHGADSNADMTDDCSGSDGAGPEYVFSVVPEQTGTVCISTDGSSYDSVLHIREAVCADSTAQVQCDDDGGESVRSTLAVELTAGETYYLFVDGFGTTSQGAFRLTSFYSPNGNCDVIPECFSDEQCRNGERCTGGQCGGGCTQNADCPFGSLCVVDGVEANGAEGACLPVDCREDVHCGTGSCVSFQCVPCIEDSQCASDELCGLDNECERTFACQNQDTGAGDACASNEECAADEVCTDMVCTRTFDCTITTNAEDGAVTDTCRQYEECRATSEDDPTAGQCVFTEGCRAREACLFEEDAEPGAPGACVFVDCSTNDDCFFFEPVCVDYACVECGADADCTTAGEVCIDNSCVFEPECGTEEIPECPDEAQDCFAGVCATPAGTCASPEVISEGTFMGTTLGGVNEHSCIAGGGGSGAEAVFEFQLGVPMSTLICANTNGSDIDTVLHVRQGVCADESAEVDCNDDGGEGLASSLSFNAQPDVSYYIFVDSFSRIGSFTLTVEPCM